MSPIVIRIQLREVYGRAKAYPVGEAAEHLAELAGTLTLTRRHLVLAEKIGMSVVETRGRDWIRELA